MIAQGRRCSFQLNQQMKPPAENTNNMMPAAIDQRLAETARDVWADTHPFPQDGQHERGGAFSGFAVGAANTMSAGFPDRLGQHALLLLGDAQRFLAGGTVQVIGCFRAILLVKFYRYGNSATGNVRTSFTDSFQPPRCLRRCG